MKSLITAAALMVSLPSMVPAAQTPPAAPPGALRQMNDSFSGVFEKVAPAVVVIESQSPVQAPISGLPQGLEFFLRSPDGKPFGEYPNVGTGFLFRADGYILTNFHVVGNAGAISVKLHDGRKFPATVVGGDERSDVAVLKIEGDHFPVANLGDSDAVRVGEFAFAIGTPMELPYTFTVGVVSAKGRNLQIGGGYEFIQTDASINPGNSGGPLCDIEGRVVGINALISGTNRGLGFSIPINTAKSIADQLMTKGRVVRPWLGIGIAGIEESSYLQRLFPGVPKGVVVSSIEEGAPVESSDLQAGDVILKVDGSEVSMASDLQHEILSKKIGQKVQLEVWRAGRTARVDVMTGEQPDPLVRVSTKPQNRRIPKRPASPVLQPSSPGFSYRDASKETLREYGITRQANGGVIVSQVEPGSPAAAAGLEEGDVITEAGGHPVLGRKDLDEVMKSASPDRGILLLLERGGHRTFAILKP
ncbi:MAG: trypsin-like peptidase domain-containing protein [Terrimicrobiaceae bacterium]|nr:trypsin-like peptidase domain-containing protein [Terrimicrobiaceae bacterium]